MKENSIEKDEEILNNIKTYMQENIDKGWHKFVYNYLGCHEKCIDIINAIEHILSDYKRVLKENGELRERIKQLEDTNKKLYEIGKEIGKQHKYTSENYIPKSKVEEKIEEIQKEYEETLKTANFKEIEKMNKINFRGITLEGQRSILRELLENRR